MQILMYVKAVRFLYKTHATDFNSAMATSEIACLRKTLMETAVVFAGVLRTKVLPFENDCSEERSKY